MRHPKALFVTVLSCYFPFATTGSAQTQSSHTETPTARYGGEGIYYELDSDDLRGDSIGSYGDTIGVPINPVRVLLIRPRASFVVELFESVEHL